MNNNDKPAANPYVLLREEFDDWAVLFDCDTGQGFGLNPAGVYVWKLLDGQHSVDAILQEISRHADSVSEDASDHISVFIEALIAQGLAALDGNAWGPEKYCYSPAVEVNAAKPFIYEPPQLINLSSGQAAYGATCSNGSHASTCCSTGNAATSYCNTGNGRSASGCCISGTCGYWAACCSGTCDGKCTSGAATSFCACPCAYGVQASSCTGNGIFSTGGCTGTGSSVGSC